MIKDINTNKTLFQVLQSFLGNFSDILNCVKIGEIISFDKSDQTCSVRILHKPKEKINRRSNKLLEYPVLQKVPCVIMGGGTSYITHPISAGDQCLLLFSDYMIDNWWATGESLPSDYPRQHDISDAIAIVGLKALPNAIQNYSDYLDLHYSNNSSIIVGDRIQLNNAIVEASGNVDVTGTVTAASVKPADGYSGLVYCGTSVLTFANGILVSVTP